MKKEFHYESDSGAVFPGFYESILYHSDSEYNFNYDDKYNFENYMECEIDDFSKFEHDVIERIALEISSYLVDGDICDKCELEGMWSPMEYNFTTDKIQLVLNLDIELLAKTIWDDEEYHKQFDRYLQRKYTSYDGFISFVENSIEEYYEKWEYLDVMVDYWLLTKIFDDKDVVKCVEKCDWTPYMDTLADIADMELYNHMVPIKDVDYIGSIIRHSDDNEKLDAWLHEKFGSPYRGFFGYDYAERIIDECKDEFYEANGILRYEEHDNVYVEQPN